MAAFVPCGMREGSAKDFSGKSDADSQISSSGDEATWQERIVALVVLQREAMLASRADDPEDTVARSKLVVEFLCGTLMWSRRLGLASSITQIGGELPGLDASY